MLRIRSEAYQKRFPPKTHQFTPQSALLFCPSLHRGGSKPHELGVPLDVISVSFYGRPLKGSNANRGISHNQRGRGTSEGLAFHDIRMA